MELLTKGEDIPYSLPVNTILQTTFIRPDDKPHLQELAIKTAHFVIKTAEKLCEKGLQFQENLLENGKELSEEDFKYQQAFGKNYIALWYLHKLQIEHDLADVEDTKRRLFGEQYQVVYIPTEAGCKLIDCDEMTFSRKGDKIEIDDHNNLAKEAKEVDPADNNKSKESKFQKMRL